MTLSQCLSSDLPNDDIWTVSEDAAVATELLDEYEGCSSGGCVECIYYGNLIVQGNTLQSRSVQHLQTELELLYIYTLQGVPKKMGICVQGSF